MDAISKRIMAVKTNPELYFRSLILYGQNVATYKFALGKSLLQLAAEGQTTIHLDDLARAFSSNMIEHVATGKSQCTNSVSSYIDACNAYHRGDISYDQLIRETKSRGFRYVLDAFHVLPSGVIAEPFYQITGKGVNRSLVITDNLLALCEDTQYENLAPEVEARWNLVEDTWTSNRGVQFDYVQYAIDTQTLIVESRTTYRRDLTKARDALSGYQRGRCFYCFRDIYVQDSISCEVDHFLPFHLRYKMPWDLNGVWNLVLSCEACNRGTGTGKFGAIPDKQLLYRLIKRNNYLINSHHPLSNTLIAQTGVNDSERAAFLANVYDFAANLTRDIWRPVQVAQFEF
jgi:hypothetical protein